MSPQIDPNSRDSRSPAGRTGPRPVVWGSLALFAVLFTFLTFQLSANAKPSTARSTGTGKAVSRSRAEEAEPEASTDAELAVEPEGEAGFEEVAPESEYVEPEYVESEIEPEYEYLEPEVEEVPPVVTSSS